MLETEQYDYEIIFHDAIEWEKQHGCLDNGVPNGLISLRSECLRVVPPVVWAKLLRHYNILDASARTKVISMIEQVINATLPESHADVMAFSLNRAAEETNPIQGHRNNLATFFDLFRADYISHRHGYGFEAAVHWYASHWRMSELSSLQYDFRPSPLLLSLAVYYTEQKGEVSDEFMDLAIRIYQRHPLNDDDNCWIRQHTRGVIKCNVRSYGATIYHVPGGRYYCETDVAWFKDECFVWTEDEARAKGFRRSKQ